jgi:hypothetical protein
MRSISGVVAGGLALAAIGCGAKSTPARPSGGAGSGAAAATGSGSGAATGSAATSTGAAAGSAATSTGAAAGSAAPGASIMPMPPGFAAADLVVLDHGALIFYKAGDAVSETARVTLPGADPEMFGFTGAWIDHDSLAISRSDGDALRLSKDGAIPLVIPAAETFRTARPRTDDEGLGEGGLEPILAIVDGAVWWSRCAWSIPNDGGVCYAWVNARLWPSPARVEADAPMRTPAPPWPTATPKGFTTTLGDHDRLSCLGPGGRTPQIFAGDPDHQEHVDEFHWVSTAPPRLLIIYGQEGYASLIPDRWTLQDACKSAPIASGTIASPGPDGLWTGASRATIGADGDDSDHDAPTTLTVFRGGRALGAVEVGPYVDVQFRPR